MIRALLLLLLLLPSVAEAKAPWTRERVAVRDYTSQEWAGVIEEQVRLINAILPPRAPAFVYERKEHVTCGSLGPQRGAIVVCESDVELACWADSVHHGAVSCHHPARKRGNAVTVRLSSWWHRGDPRWMNYMVCHELMHAIAWVNDVAAIGEHAETSCVHGWLPHPGPWDAELARKAFAKGKQKRHR